MEVIVKMRRAVLIAARFLTAVAILAGQGIAVIFAWHDISGSAGETVRRVSPASSYDAIGARYGVAVHVSRVIDGDTIELAGGEHLRYLGIDTPEEVDPRKPVQCFATEAAERNKELVEGKDVVFYKDVSERDRYGRLLGFVYLPDGTFVNRMLVSEGYAFSYAYPPDVSMARAVRSAEESARKLRLGLWAACTATSGRNGHEQTNAVK